MKYLFLSGTRDLDHPGGRCLGLLNRRDRLGLAPPVVEKGHLLHAGHRTEGCAGLLRRELAAQVLAGIVGQSDPWIAALLRAVMDQPVLTNIKIAGPGPAAPFVRK